MAKQPDLGGIDRHELEKELARRDRKINTLLRNRARAMEAVDEIDQQLAELGHKGNKARAGAPRGASIGKDLAEAICDCVWGAMDWDDEMTTGDIAVLIIDSEVIESQSVDYAKQLVSRALGQDKRFTSPRRGVWKPA